MKERRFRGSASSVWHTNSHRPGALFKVSFHCCGPLQTLVRDTVRAFSRAGLLGSQIFISYHSLGKEYQQKNRESLNSMVDLGRIQKELREIERDKTSGVTVQLKSNNLQRLTGFVEGPRDTSYEGGLFVVDIQLEDQYPFVPPKMRFRSKVWHPNVSSANGAICLDILKDQWSPALTLKTALLSLQALLSSPQPDDPQDAVVARQYLSDNASFQRQARLWTENFASRSQAMTEDEKVLRLADMGFSRDAAVVALQTANGDENSALELLLAAI